MHPLTHALLGWPLVQAVPLTRSDRALVTLAGVIPDVDGLALSRRSSPATARIPCCGGARTTTCSATIWAVRS
jgi:hypothetical protein